MRINKSMYEYNEDSIDEQIVSYCYVCISQNEYSNKLKNEKKILQK